MCVSSLMGKSKCVDYNVLLANIQFQATFGDLYSMVYMLTSCNCTRQRSKLL